MDEEELGAGVQVIHKGRRKKKRKKKKKKKRYSVPRKPKVGRSRQSTSCMSKTVRSTPRLRHSAKESGMALAVSYLLST